MAFLGQTGMAYDTTRENGIIFNEKTTLGELVVQGITVNQDVAIRVPDNYKQTCKLGSIRINCTGTIDSEKLDQQDGTYLSVYVGKQCTVDLSRAEGEVDEEISVMQFRLRGERIIIKQILIKPTINQNYQFNNHTINMETLEKETRKRSVTDKLETTTQLNNTEHTVTNSPEQIKSNAITTTPTIATQVKNEEGITKQLSTSTTRSHVVTTVNESHVNATTVNKFTEINYLRNVTIVSNSHIPTNTLEKSTQANEIREIAKSSESIKTTTIIYDPVREKGLEFEYVYVICVIMGIIILAMIIAVINLCHYYKVIGRSRFDYLNPIAVRSYSTRDNLELSETRL
ncbi:unnamed protein product [Macrosiphum euphorbiae]|uniref:Uncharacterized protein n=1 Tax=Macrosiphum euphorbiae TaxID=13131 RepID=A0AAV0XTX7_9HEMI|nr:unnamed protein product [Macrosiphum euphorbiae]